MLAVNGHANAPPKPPMPELPKPKAKATAVTRRYSTIERTKVNWLVPGWLPLGKLIVLDGDPGLGKSTLLLDIAARVTTHGVGFNNQQGPTGNVVILNGRGRSQRHHPWPPRSRRRQPADGHRPVAHQPGRRPKAPEIPADLDLIESVVKEHKAKLLIIEPLTAFLFGPDANKDQEIRRVLYKLSKIAERQNCTIIVLRHLNKTSGGKALYRGNTSIAIIGHARIGLLVTEDPDDDRFRILSMVKTNCGPLQPSLRFALTPVDDVCKITWHGQSPYKADQLVSQPSDAEKAKSEDMQTKIAQARAILEMLLAASNGIIPIKETRQELTNAGIGHYSWERAVKELGLTVSYDTDANNQRVYFWVSPTAPETTGGSG
jgi:hypothetical protein